MWGPPGFQQPGFQQPGFGFQQPGFHQPGMIPPPHLQVQMQQQAIHMQRQQMALQQMHHNLHQQQIQQQQYQQMQQQMQQQQYQQQYQQQPQQYQQPYQQPEQEQPGKQQTSPDSILSTECMYAICTAFNPDIVLDIKGENVVIQDRDEGNAKQLFRFRLVNGKYQIFSSTGLTVQVPGKSKKEGEAIIASDNNNTSNEFWEIEMVEGSQDTFFIKSFCGKALDLQDGMGTPGNKVIQNDFNGGETQQWQVVEVSDYDESSVAKPKVFFPSTKKFTISLSSNPELSLKAVGQKIVLADTQQCNEQQFTFRLINGVYQIFTCGRNVLQIPEGSEAPDCQVCARQNDNEDNEYWDIQPLGNNKYYIVSHCKLRLNPYNGMPINNNKIVQAEPNDYETQKWFIKPI